MNLCKCRQVTVSTVNMLTTVLNDSPVFPEGDEEEDDLSAPLLMDSPQCVLFGTVMVWFASITINLGNSHTIKFYPLL